ncbi:MAG: hypothetical protein ACOYXY_08640 [Thermodesulfobacteriota bacterium]
MGRSSKPEAEAAEVAGRALKCLICGHDRFNKREALLNTASMTFFNLDWANASGMCMVCDNCGFIHWFLPK